MARGDLTLRAKLSCVDRVNSEGILQRDLALYLRERRFVIAARRNDTCMLCRRAKVNEAGLCDYCYATLDGEEARLAATWLTGQGP
jgi:hypothetical protein